MSTRLFDALDFEGVDDRLNLGRSLRDDGVISIGYTFRRNAGWLERFSGLSYPWMETVADTIPSDMNTLHALYKPEDMLVRDVCSALAASPPGGSVPNSVQARLSAFEDASLLSFDDFSASLSACPAGRIPLMNTPQRRYLHDSILEPMCQENYVGGAEKISFPPSMGRITPMVYDRETNSMVPLYDPPQLDLPSATESYAFKRARLGVAHLCEDENDGGFIFDDFTATICSFERGVFDSMGADDGTYENSPQENRGLSTGENVGIAAGTIAGVAVLGGIIYATRRHKDKKGDFEADWQKPLV
jgi:hypothetical protein